MLSQADNDTLTQVGPGTVMGNFMRRFWMPALLESELPENDGTPVRIRLLGENLVAFRDTEGRIGLLDERCPHRGTSLALAVNGECGLRCLFHGWKFDVNGQCTDTPAEPEGSTLAKAMRVTAYPTRVAGGMIWTYMGPKEHTPEFPHFPWFDMEPGHCEAFKVIYECNYAQSIEGAIDSAHAGVLHRESPWGHEAKWPHEKDLRPKLEVEMTNYGLRYCAVRRDGDMNHARMTQVPLPFWTFIPPDGEKAPAHRRNRRLINAFVPRDDTTTWHMQFFYDATQVISREDRLEEAGTHHDADFFKLVNIRTWYDQDREMMRTTNMSGIVGIAAQDHAVSETMGPISDRTKEHLGRTDMAVVGWRRALIRAARDLAETGKHSIAPQDQTDWSKVVAETFLYTDDKGWKDVVPLPEDMHVHVQSAA